MDVFNVESRHENMAPVAEQMNLPFTLSETEGGADLEPEAELASNRHAKVNDPGFAASESFDDTSSDSSDASTSDFSNLMDIITSAAATWCVHRASEAADGDPLVSFFSQLISSHRVCYSVSLRQPCSSQSVCPAYL